jgi:hypothetical protein
MEEGTLVEYVLVLKGRLGDALDAALRPTSVDVRSDSTQMVVEAKDDAEMYSILDRLERLGISIISFAQHPVAASEDED